MFWTSIVFSVFMGIVAFGIGWAKAVDYPELPWTIWIFAGLFALISVGALVVCWNDHRAHRKAT